jgi:hypothetical protein
MEVDKIIEFISRGRPYYFYVVKLLIQATTDNVGEIVWIGNYWATTCQNKN